MSLTSLAGMRSSDLTTFTVKVDGSPIDGSIGVVSIDITRAVNRIPVARLVVDDGDAAAQDFAVSGGQTFVPGATIEIEVGYSSEESLLFKGVVTAQRVRVRRTGGGRLVVEARDAAFAMTLDRKSHCFQEMTDSDAFEEILAGYPGLVAEVEATTVQQQELVQYQCSDWDFLVSRAEKMGMVCLVEDGTVRVQKPDASQDAAKSVSYGMGLFDLDLELDARTQLSSVEASAWDHADQALVSSQVDDAESPPHGDLAGVDLATAAEVFRYPAPLDQGEIDAWAQARMTRSRFARIRGVAKFQGTEELSPGDALELGGLGDRFNGVALVSGVRHQIGHGDWETTTQIGLDPVWHHERVAVTAPAAAGFHGAVAGLQIAVVTQLEGDPAGENRIQVSMPVVDPNGAGVWARVATLDAGASRGSFFLPEIGDEVVVGFLAGDPRHPVVVGALNSSNKPAPFTASDDNHEKGLVTRSGMKVTFDDEAPSVTIETPGGHRVSLNDGEGTVVVADAGGSSITLDSSGITLDSAQAITLRAATDLTAEGLNVNVSASAALKASGSASAGLTSDGSTEVKGSIVQIN